MWRAKWWISFHNHQLQLGQLHNSLDDEDCSYLVLACMHGGCRVLQLRIHRTNITHIAGNDAGDVGDAGDINDSNGIWEITVLENMHQIDERNAGHLAYGIDVISTSDGEQKSESKHGVEPADIDIIQQRNSKIKLASCSFYDNLVQLWEASTKTV